MGVGQIVRLHCLEALVEACQLQVWRAPRVRPCASVVELDLVCYKCRCVTAPHRLGRAHTHTVVLGVQQACTSSQGCEAAWASNCASFLGRVARA